MTTLKEVREAMARLLQGGTGLDAIAYVPATPRAGTVFVRPANSERAIDYRGQTATFCKPEHVMKGVLISGTADWSNALDWLEDYQERVVQTIKANPKCDGLINSWSVSHISEPLLWGDFLTADIHFGSFVLRSSS